MSSIGCPDCGKTNYDVELENATKRAKTVAIDNAEPQAIYKEGGEYLYAPARVAIENNYPVLRFVSAYQ